MTTTITTTTLDTIATLERAPSVLKVKEIFRRAIEKHGYEHFLCSAPPRPQDSQYDPVLFEEWPPAWRRRYSRRRYFVCDPMLLELYRTADPFSWADVLDRGTNSAAERAVMHDASAWGMNEGFVVPIYGIGGQMHAVTMSGRAPRSDLTARAELHLLSIYAYGRAKFLAGRETDPTPVLRPHERETLLWAAAGKSDWEISRILRVSEGAIHKRIEAIKRRMGVGTRVQAIVAAIRSGQIAL